MRWYIFAVVNSISQFRISYKQLLSSNEEAARQVEFELVDLGICTLHLGAN